ncbi:MAG: nuclear transport factor 2 family protein, partial [Pseudomonadota bacterium]|nr:nuclear transport factor 2 family protein [Pseudomonadota bacterium]
PEAVFFSGDKPLRGRDAILQKWKQYFESASPPFSWQPDTVEVLASGSLALTSGPVLDSAGTLIGRFNSVWREGSDKVWRVVFDKGSEVCSCGKP